MSQHSLYHSTTTTTLDRRHVWPKTKEKERFVCCHIFRFPDAFLSLVDSVPKGNVCLACSCKKYPECEAPDGPEGDACDSCIEGGYHRDLNAKMCPKCDCEAFPDCVDEDGEDCALCIDKDGSHVSGFTEDTSVSEEEKDNDCEVGGTNHTKDSTTKKKRATKKAKATTETGPKREKKEREEEKEKQEKEKDEASKETIPMVKPENLFAHTKDGLEIQMIEKLCLSTRSFFVRAPAQALHILQDGPDYTIHVSTPSFSLSMKSGRPKGGGVPTFSARLYSPSLLGHEDTETLIACRVLVNGLEVTC